jgi:hypothetical protein
MGAITHMARGTDWLGELAAPEAAAARIKSVGILGSSGWKRSRRNKD